MELPDWYYRVSVTSDLENREVKGSDFDEDLSELGEGEGDSEVGDSDVACGCDSEDECECGIQDECGCGSEDECECDLWEDDDEESIRLQGEKKLVPENPIVYPAYEAILEAQNARGCPESKDRASEAQCEQEVFAAYEAMLEAQERGDCPRIETIVNQMFELYSVDFHDYCSDKRYFRQPYVEFNALDSWDSEDSECEAADPEEAMAYGHIYLDSDHVSEFEAFYPPRKACQLKIPLLSGPSEHEPIIQFISDKYFIMTVRTDLDIVASRIRFRNPEAANIPDVFHFVGIREGPYDYDSFDYDAVDPDA